MLRRLCLIMLIAWASLWGTPGSSRGDDYEDELLHKFQNQNKSAGDKLKQEAARLLKQGHPSNQPEKELEPLRKLLGQLHGDTFLPNAERTSLIRKLQERLLECQSLTGQGTSDPLPSRTVSDKKLAEESLDKTSARDPKIKVKQAALVVTNAGSTLVPDRGARELAGYSFFAESRNEYGTPGLGKIPYLGRAFRNVGYGSVSGGASISVSVRIIIPQEEEARFLLGR